MKLTLNQAAKTCGRAKSTILDAIKSGVITAPKDDRGRYAIDPSELNRVFPIRADNQAENRTAEPIPTASENRHIISGLERDVELLREMLVKSEETAENWRKMAERQQALIEDQRPRRLFQRWFGRN